ncbi:type III-A CRISPR-associated RAMP protein Csm3 [Archaeoglobales archaeon]|nr:MAG: type III-A CRISPR-associated RAMP protein Csm3 [Archaeoglobales archaeon]
MRAVGIIKISTNLRVETGLHIGAQMAGISIGATDNPVIKINGVPYIPGSSLKGKIRSLLELAHGVKFNRDGRHECSGEACDICTVFGRSGNLKGSEGQTRVIFRDAYVNEKMSDEYARNNNYVEIKYENVIDRIRGTVRRGGLRDVERVLPGTVFDVEIAFRVFESDVNGEEIRDLSQFPEKLKSLFGLVLEGMRMLEDDCLGGCGSRGYGKVKFGNIRISYTPTNAYRGDGETIDIFSGSLDAAIKSLKGT